MARGKWWDKDGRAERFQQICINFQSDSPDPDNFLKNLEAKGMSRSKWNRYRGKGQTPAVPADVGELWFVAEIMGRTRAHLEAEIMGIPYAPKMEDFATMEEWAKTFTDNDFRQLCKVSTPNRVSRFVAIAIENLRDRIET